MKKKINTDLATKISMALFCLFVAVLIGLSLFIPTIKITTQEQVFITKIVFGVFGGLSGIFGFLLTGFTIFQKENENLNNIMEITKNERNKN
jgi:hypothetical protein